MKIKARDNGERAAIKIHGDDNGDSDSPECVIIGAGPAGLTAATYLARFHRRIAVYDAGSSRAALIPASHNYPGMGRRGIPGKKLLAQLRHQAQHFGARIVSERITEIRARDNSQQQNAETIAGFTLIDARGATIDTQRVLIATGMDDVLPAALQSHSAIRRGVVRLCSICDGYETVGKCIAALGAGSSALTHALFLRTFCCNVSAVLIGADDNSDDDNFGAQLREAEKVALPVIRADIDAVRICGDDVVVTDSAGRTHRFDCIYPAMGSHYRVDAARGLNIACADNGAIAIDDHCRTSVPGMFAAGDVTPAIKQICVAIAQGAIAAIAMHNSLEKNCLDKRGRDDKTPSSPATSTSAINR